MKLRQLLCWHENVIQHKDDRIYLSCLKCGLESPGWNLGKDAVKATIAISAVLGLFWWWKRRKK